MKMKRTLALLLAFAMVLSTMGISVFATETTGTVNSVITGLGGAGTEDDPYLITCLEELEWFRDDVNAGNTYADQYVLLTADIDLTGKVWTPIGTSVYDKTPSDADVKMFAGNFDGGNHTITGLSSVGYVPASSETGSTEYSFGLFGYVYGANISNVKLEDVAIDCGARANSDGSEVYGAGVGALIGYYVPVSGKTSIVENCHVLSGSVKAFNNMGGLMGMFDSQKSLATVDVTIKNCSNAAEVEAEARDAGGILGLINGSREAGDNTTVMRGSITFENCTNTGNVTTLGGGSVCAGGIIGRDNAAFSGQRLKLIFDGCTNSGTITVHANGETHIGGLGTAFYSHGSWLVAKNSSNTGNVVVENPENASPGLLYVGGLFAYAGVIDLIDSTSTGPVMVGDESGNTYVGSAASILFLEGIDDFNDTIDGYTYYLNGGTSPEYAALVDDAANGGNFHMVETAYRDQFTFEGWYDNADCTGDAYTALSPSVKTYYAKWGGPVAEIDGTYYNTLEEAAAEAQSGDTIELLGNVTLADILTLPADITLKGNNKSIDGEVWAAGDLTFEGHTKVTNFNAGYNKPVITIGEGACLELTGSGRMVIGHGATFNITGSIADAKTADVTSVKPSLIMYGASFTGADVNFNVTNAYIKATYYCSTSKSASGIFNFNITNSIWEQENKLAFEAQSTAVTVNFNLKDSVLTTTSHVLFSVPGETVIDNSLINSTSNVKQIENRSNMTVKNGSVVYGANATSSNAKNPGTLTVDNATYIGSGEFSGADLGIGTLVLKNNAKVTLGSISKTNVTVDGTSKLTTSKFISDYTITVDTANLALGENVTVIEQTASNAVSLENNVTVTKRDDVILTPVYDDGDITLKSEAIAAVLGDNQYFGSVKAALDAAYDAGMKDIVITLVGDTDVNTTDSIDLYSNYNNGTAFNTVTIRQKDASKPYYLDCVYTGWTTGKFVFDGVNLVVDGQFFAINRIELINNSTIARDDDVKNFIFYGDMYIEPGSKYISQIDGLSNGSTLTVDGGRTDGAFNSTADYKTVYLTVEAGNTMNMKNGAYVIASNYETSTATIDGTLNMEASKFKGCQTLFVNGVLNIDAESVIEVNNIQGTGKIVVDAKGMKEEDVKVLEKVNLSNFTGQVEVENVNFAIELYRRNNLTRSDEWVLVDRYATLAEATAAAESGDKIQLVWEEGDDPIAMNGAVFGKDITITGTASVDWSKGFLFIGRGGAGDATVTFDNANLKSASNQRSTGIHVSGREKDTADKYDGTLVINNSIIELDYLINKGDIILDNSTFTVKNGFAVGGRPATETESGEDATATMTLNNGSKVIVNNHNGMGLGYEAIGIMNVNTGSAFECTQDFLITEKGTMNVDGGNVTIAGKLTNLGVNTTFKDATVKIEKLDNDAALFVEGTNTIQVEDASGSSYAIRVNDGAVLNDSYIPGTANETVRLLGSATFNGGFRCAYLQGSSAGVGGTVTIEDGTVVDASYGVEFSKDYTINGGTIKLSGGNESGEYWGCVFQSGTFTINSDIIVEGNGSTAPIYFTKATATVNGNLSQSRSGGEPIYIGAGSTVTFGDDAVVTTDCAVYVTGTLKSTGTVNGKITKASDTAVIELYGGTYTQDVSEWAADGFKAIKQERTGLYHVFPDFVVEAIADVEDAVAGDTITVVVKVTEGGNYTNASWTLKYDPRYVTYTGTDDRNFKISGNVSDGDTDDGTDEFDAEYVLETYTFTVNEIPAPATAVFEIVEAEVHNYEMAIEFDGVPATTREDSVSLLLKDGTGVIAPDEVPYNGAEQRGNEVTGAPAGARITYSETNDFTNGTNLPPAFVNVGEHTYYAKIEVDGYDAKVVEGKLTITAIEVSPSVTWSVAPESDLVGYKPVINGVLDDTFTGTVTVKNGDEVIKTFDASEFAYNGHGSAVYTGDVQKITGVTSGILTLTVIYNAGADDNYATSENSTSVDVDKSTIDNGTKDILDATITGTGDIVYDGETHYVDYDATALPDGWTADVAIHEGVKVYGDINVVDVTFTDTTGKYNDYTATVLVKIVRREVTIYVNNATKKNGQADSEATNWGTTASPSIIGTDLGEIKVVRAEGQDGEAEGTYDITATYTPNNNYIVKVVDGKLTIFDAVVKIEVVDNSKNSNAGFGVMADYTAGTRMILVHTDADYAFFTYDGKPMYDVSEANYPYVNHDYDNDIHTEEGRYQHVYAIVVPAEFGYEASELNESLYAGKVSYAGKEPNDAAYAPIKVTYDADINDKDELHINDYSTVKGVYNSIYASSTYQMSILKADFNKNKMVNTLDAQLVKNIVNN